MTVVVCWKYVARRVEVDPLTASVTVDEHSWGPSPADEAALEVALASGLGDVTVVCAGPPAADTMLRSALAVGATSVVRCPSDAAGGSHEVAAALAQVAEGADLVLCGDYSADRGSGAVPAFLAAALGVAQALGVVGIAPADGGVAVERRLDGGRRERLRVGFPAVVSVEGSVARLRRASLPAVLAAESAPVLVGPAVAASGASPLGPARPFRPRTRPRPSPPDAAPLARVLAITQATTERTPPRVVHAAADEAAGVILDQLRDWGYLADEP